MAFAITTMAFETLTILFEIVTMAFAITTMAVSIVTIPFAIVTMAFETLTILIAFVTMAFAIVTMAFVTSTRPIVNYSKFVKNHFPFYEASSLRSFILLLSAIHGITKWNLQTNYKQLEVRKIHDLSLVI